MFVQGFHREQRYGDPTVAAVGGIQRVVELAVSEAADLQDALWCDALLLEEAPRGAAVLSPA